MNLPMISNEKGSLGGQSGQVRVKESIGHIIGRACGAMETRQTTNLKIAGSTPARLVFLTSKNEGQKEERQRSGSIRTLRYIYRTSGQ